MDFVGATQLSIYYTVIYLSSDGEEAMEGMSTSSLLYVPSSSGEEVENVRIMAPCAERRPRAGIPVGQTSSQRYFELGQGNVPIRFEQAVRANHPITIWRNVIPFVDTTLSSPLPIEDR